MPFSCSSPNCTNRCEKKYDTIEAWKDPQSVKGVLVYEAEGDVIMTKCPCHDLTLPRWDIYICPYCKRKLAWFEPVRYPSTFLSLLSKIKKFLGIKTH